MITFTFLDADGKKITQTTDTNSIEDATIEGTNVAEENGWELVEVIEDVF